MKSDTANARDNGGGIRDITASVGSNKHARVSTAVVRVRFPSIKRKFALRHDMTRAHSPPLTAIQEKHTTISHSLRYTCSASI
jgi:hypothetical protein